MDVDGHRPQIHRAFRLHGFPVRLTLAKSGRPSRLSLAAQLPPWSWVVLVAEDAGQVLRARLGPKALGAERSWHISFPLGKRLLEQTKALVTNRYK